MKYLVHWKMCPAPAEEVLKLLPNDLEFCMNLMKEKKLLASYVLVGQPEGFEVFEVESNEEMHKIILEAPFGPFLDFKVWPIVDFDYSLNTLKSVLEKSK
ncbi:MAG: muconolactone Delta-isomerase family protein [Candidatus Humimicrobiaceae bacterium]